MEKRHAHRILLVSLQKCGTHLIKNVFDQIGLEGVGVGRATLADFERLNDNQYLWSHFAPTDAVQMELENENTDLRIVFNFRDPRDVLVSWFNWMHPEAPRVMHKHHAYMKKVYANFSDAELMDIFIRNDKFRLDEYNPLEHFRLSRVLYFHPSVLNIRFEELVGSGGGGNDDRQRKTVQDILEYLGVFKASGEVENIFDVNSPTFRSGRIGGYKNVLTADQIRLVNELHGSLIKQYGYTPDEIG
jgi:hypothetical protein